MTASPASASFGTLSKSLILIKIKVLMLIDIDDLMLQKTEAALLIAAATVDQVMFTNFVWLCGLVELEHCMPVAPVVCLQEQHGNNVIVSKPFIRWIAGLQVFLDHQQLYSFFKVLTA